MPSLQPGRTRRELRASTFDGVSYSLMQGAGEFFFAAFVLALGHGGVAAGIVAGASPVLGGLLQMATPWGIRRVGSHKHWVLLCAGLQAAAFIPLALGAAAGSMPAWAVFLATTAYWAGGLGAWPAWITWIGATIPRRVRARYFARRNGAMQVGLLTGFLLAGWSLHATAPGQALGTFAGMFTLAALCRGISIWCLAGQAEDPAALPTPRPPDLRAFAASAARSRNGRLLGYMLAVQGAVYTASPFFAPYVLGVLDLGYGAYTLTVATFYLSKIAGVQLAGRVARRHGSRNVLVLGGLGLAPITAAWLAVDGLSGIMLVQVASGLVWGSYELGQQLAFFEVVDERERTGTLTCYNLLNWGAGGAGTLAGAALLSGGNDGASAYLALFAVSAALRAGTLLLLYRAITGRGLALGQARFARGS